MSEKSSKSLMARLAKRQKDLKNSGGGGYRYIIFKDEGIKRLRPLNVGEDNDWAQEIVFFYLGGDIKGYISPATFGEPCAIYEKYQKLMKSGDDDKDFAKTKMAPRKKYMMLVVPYKDDKGKEVDTETGAKLVLLAISQYKDVLDLYLDPEQGDFTDIKEGYDLKFKREGKGQMDTEYSVIPCKPTAVDKKFRGPYDLEKEVRKLIPTYEESKAILKEFLNGVGEDDSEEKKGKKGKDKKKKKKKKSDL